MYRLLQIEDGNVISEHKLDAECFRIGRSPGNHLQPDDPSVSATHAEIRLTPSQYMDGMMDVMIHDLDSTNGTRVNGRAVKKQLLKHGDLISMGTMSLKFIDEQSLAVEGTRILLQESES